MQRSFRYRPQEIGPAGGDPSVSDVLLASLPSASVATDNHPSDELQTTVKHRQGDGAQRHPETPAPVLPGFENLQLLGRGGMGVVYRARQVSLGRDVALKIIASGGAADAEERLRFHWEAQAIARLQHPNIVQIFEVGQADGLDYLTLELVPGGTLKHLIAGRPQPLADAAALVEALARAVHEAHLRGVIHRDLKPDNVLLTLDRVPKISDFGLARHVDVEHRALTEGVFGTAWYMAPEQAWGGSRLREVGPPADVYSLGVMLYELITGHVPFVGKSLQFTLEKVWAERPARLRPQRWDCPADLEQICLKCLEKRPERRYSSAEALADDLRRFLAQQPVAARPVGLVQRTGKWARRRPAAAALAAVSLLAGAVTLGGGAWYQTQLSAALGEARSNLESAQEAVDKLLSDLSVRGLAPLPQSESLQQQVLRNAVGLCQQLLSEHPRDNAVRQQNVRARRQLADLEQLLGELPASAADYDRAIELSAALVASDPHTPAYRRELAVALNNRGNLAAYQQHPDAALADYRQALDVWRGLVDHEPRSAEFARGLAAAWTNLGRAQSGQGHTEQAQEAYEQALAVLRDSSGTTEQRTELVALAHNNLGTLLHAGGDQRQALEQFSAGLAAFDSPAAPRTSRPEIRLLHAALLRNRAIASTTLGEPAAAQGAYDLAVAELRSLHADFPRIPDVALELAGALRETALFAESANPKQARALYTEALELYAAAGAARPDVRAQLGESICWERLSQPELAVDAAAGEAAYQQALELATTLLEAQPHDPEACGQLAVVLHAGAVRLASANQHAAAIGQLQRAVQLQSQAHSARPGEIAFARQLARHDRLLATELIEQGELAQAAEVSAQLRQLAPLDHAAALDAGRLLARCVSLSASIRSKVPLLVAGQPLAEYCTDHAAEALAAALAAGTIDGAQLAADPAFEALHGQPAFERLLSDRPDAETDADAAPRTPAP